MNKGLFYLLGAALAAVSARFARGWLLRLAFGWCAVAATWFGVGYLTNFGEFLFKSSRGRLPIPVKFFLAPVLLGASLYNAWKRATDSGDPFTRIRDGLWLGRRLLPGDLLSLQKNGITAILDVTAEFDALSSHFLPEGTEYLNIPVFDHCAPRQSQLTGAVQWIGRQRRAGRQVIVHCALGQGRSVTALLAYLHHLEPDRPITALLDEIQGLRATARPNRRQLRALDRLADQPPIQPRTRAFVVFNPSAGSGDADTDRDVIREELDPFLDLEFATVDHGSDADELVRSALGSGVDIVIAAGGDGTVAATASALIGHDIPLGIIPRGTANALAASIMGESIRIDPVRSGCRHILAGHTRPLDAARHGESFMFQLAGIGVEAGMVDRSDRELKDRWGPLAYFAAAWKETEAPDLFHATIVVDGERHEFRTGSVVVSNAAPIASVFARGAGKPDYQDGQLGVTVVVDIDTRVKALGAMISLLNGGLEGGVENPNIHHFKGRRIEITCEPGEDVAIDGKIGGQTPIQFEAIPGAVQILVAPDEPD